MTPPERTAPPVTTPSAAGDESVRPSGWWAAVLLALTLTAYAGAFGGAWVYDDIPGILENPTIRSLRSAFSPPAASGLPVSGRPLVNASFALNYALSGTNAASYHAVNLLIHLGAVLVLFGIVRRTLAAHPKAHSTAPIDLIAFATASMWAVHPVLTEAVTYVAQRAESLMGLCFLLTVYACIRTARSGASQGWSVLAVTACGAGMATKEVMAVAPLVVALYDWTFLDAAARGRRRPLYAALAATWLILLWFVWHTGSRGGTAGFEVKATWWSYLMTQLHAQALYLKLAVWPHPLVFDYGVDRMPFAWPWPTLLAAESILLVLVVFAIRRRSPLGFVGGVYALIMAPTSLVPIVTETIAEHRLYLPLACVAAAIVVGVTRWIGRPALYALIAAVPAWAALTAHRQHAYLSERALWSDTVAKWPENGRAQYNLGRALAEGGNFNRAVPHYELALQLHPELASAHSNLANAFVELGRTREGEAEAREALRLKPTLPEAHNTLGNALLLGGDLLAAADEYRESVRLDPGNADFHNNLGTALTRLGLLDEALREYATAAQLRPDSPLIHFNRANTYARLGRFSEAIPEYEATLRLKPDYPGARDHLERVGALQRYRESQR